MSNQPMTDSQHKERAKKREIQEKLNKQYIDNKINPIVEPMALALFGSEAGQKNPIPFMLDYIKENFGNRPSVNEGEQQELDYLRKQVASLKAELGKGASGAQRSTKSDNDDSSDGSESEGDFVEELPVAKNQSMAQGARMSVSAEVFGKFNMQKEYKPPVHEKTAEQIEKIKSRMSSNFMFSALNPKDRAAILGAIVPVSMKASEVVITQGDDGDNFYLLEEGTLTCTKRFKPEDEADTFLKEYQPGESFGELALLYNAPRAATIVCKTDSQLWSLERGAFNAIIKTAVQKKREKYDDFLENVEILKNMEKYERTKLADAFKEEWFEEGHEIIKEGDQNDNSSFYMIIEGECIASKVLQPGTPATVVKNYKPGDYFGERSLLKDVPRAATIVAQSQVCVVSLDRQSFKRLMGPMEEILARNEEEYKKFC